MNTKRKFTVDELKDVTGWQGPTRTIRLYPDGIVIVGGGLTQETDWTIDKCKRFHFTPLTGQPLIDAIRALGYEVEEGTTDAAMLLSRARAAEKRLDELQSEQRYTAREWLELTLPEGGKYRTISTKQYVYYHGQDDMDGIHWNVAGHIHGTVGSVGGGRFYPEAYPIIPRSTAIDLMVKGIDGGEVHGQAPCNTCNDRGKIPSGVYEQPPEPCPTCTPDPYAHLPHGGWWFDVDSFSLQWSDGIKAEWWSRSGVSQGKATPIERNLPRLTRAQAIAIIEANKAKQEQPASTMLYQSPPEVESIKAWVEDNDFQPRPADPQPAPAFKVGDRVSSKDNGEMGTVVDVTTNGHGQVIVKVRFGPAPEFEPMWCHAEKLQPAPAMGPHDDLAREWVAKHHPEYEVVGWRQPTIGELYISWVTSDQDKTWMTVENKWGVGVPRYILARKAKGEPVEVNGKIIGLADMPGFAEAYSMFPKSASGTSIDRDLFELVKAMCRNYQWDRFVPSNTVNHARKLLAEMRSSKEDSNV